MKHRYSTGALKITAPDGEAYSYQTALMATMADGRRVYNFTRYSPTTSKHLSEVLGVTDPPPGVDLYVKGVQRGATATDLRVGAKLGILEGGTLPDPIGKAR